MSFTKRGISMSGILQNISVLSQGPRAVGDPCASVYHQQQHIAYRDESGIIWDSWYDGGWHLQKINGLDGKTSGPVAVAGPFIGVFNDQQHFGYLDNTGIISDSWYDGHGNWNLQEINFLSSSDAPAFIDTRPGAPPPMVAIWTDGANSQQHFTYLTVEPASFRDIFWDSGNPSHFFIDIPAHWTHQTLQDAGVKPGSSPVVGVFGHQQHVVYLEDSTGSLVDHWYDGDSQWNVQRITGTSGNTSGPPTLHGTLPAVWVDHSNTQQHFTYVGVDRAIYDAFWDGDRWQLQKLTSGGQTDGPAAWSSPSVCNYQTAGKINAVYIAYRDQIGMVWTIAYGNGSWFAFHLKDLPFGEITSAADLPLAAGNVTVWVDVSSNQLHYTFRGTDLQGSVITGIPSVAVESREVTGTRRHPTTGLTHAGPGILASGVIWDFFYEP
jgi:hypothetical protein